MIGFWKRLFGKKKPPIRKGLDWVLVESGDTGFETSVEAENHASPSSIEYDKVTPDPEDRVLI